MSVVLLGVPWNSSGTTDGVARAPSALRAAGILGVRDDGDIAVDPPSAARGPDGVIDGPDLARTLARVAAAVEAIARAGDVPLLVGGDCPILLGGLTGIAAADPEGRVPGLLFVDGHEDAWPAAASTTGEAADMELGWLLGLGVDDLDPSLRDAIPLADRTRAVLLGPRDGLEIAEAGIPSVAGLVPILDDAGVRADPVRVTRDAMQQVLSQVPPKCDAPLAIRHIGWPTQFCKKHLEPGGHCLFLREVSSCIEDIPEIGPRL